MQESRSDSPRAQPYSSMRLGLGFSLCNNLRLLSYGIDDLIFLIFSAPSRIATSEPEFHKFRHMSVYKIDIFHTTFYRSRGE